MPLVNQVNARNSILQLNTDKKNPIPGPKLDIHLGFICLYKILKGKFHQNRGQGLQRWISNCAEMYLNLVI